MTIACPSNVTTCRRRSAAGRTEYVARVLRSFHVLASSHDMPAIGRCVRGMTRRVRFRTFSFNEANSPWKKGEGRIMCDSNVDRSIDTPSMLPICGTSIKKLRAVA